MLFNFQIQMRLTGYCFFFSFFQTEYFSAAAFKLSLPQNAPYQLISACLFFWGGDISKQRSGLQPWPFIHPKSPMAPLWDLETFLEVKIIVEAIMLL